MKQATAVGLDIAKHGFQAHRVDKAGRVAFKRKLRRHEVEKILLAGWNLARWALRPVEAGTTGHGFSGPPGTRCV